MVYVYEFELFESEQHYLVYPFDLPGGTQGESIQDAAAMAADWLKLELEHRAMHGIDFPKATFGNLLQHGGERLLVAVEAGRETIPRVTQADAARRLGVTPGRVSQMVAANKLESFECDGRTWITLQSVEARLAEKPHPGRPRKVADKAAVVAG